ncbi:MAG: tetratricopeptide repeat protein [Verrucomicrobia bacterium]|nr:tetratricopeptide repeat protein [Verrucomicrobiota bacterium]
MKMIWAILISGVLILMLGFLFLGDFSLQKPAVEKPPTRTTTTSHPTPSTSVSSNLESMVEPESIAVAPSGAPFKSGGLSAARESEELYANGNLMARGVLKQTADGRWIKHGAWTNYWANGAINSFGQYENGEKIGAWPFWMETGEFLITNQYHAAALVVAKTEAKSPVQSTRQSPAQSATEAQGKLKLGEPLAAESGSQHSADATGSTGAAKSAGSGCVATQYLFLDWNANVVAATLEALFPELLFEFDSKAQTLKATGCSRHLALLNPLTAAARTEDMVRWQTEVERRLWNASGQARLSGGGQVGLFRHSVYGFELKKPSGDWKTVSVTPDTSWAQRLGGKAVYGLTLTQKNARLTFVTLDFNDAKTAGELGEPDAKLPLALWPQAIADAKWVKASAGDYSGRVGGIQACDKTVYRARALWFTSVNPSSGGNTGADRIVCDRFYIAQPSAGSGTRLYFFMLTMPLAEHAAAARWLEDFVGGFSMPETPMQPVIPRTPGPLLLAAKSASASAQSTGPSSIAGVKTAAPAIYVWQLTKNPSVEIQAALRANVSTHHAETESLWKKTLPTLSRSERPEGLWYLACAQIQQRKYSDACSVLQQFLKESPDHPLAFQTALTHGMVQGFYRQEWTQAHLAWQHASKLARDETQKWQVACKLATVPFYKRQYRQALEAFESLLKEYPTEKTADFARWYIWYLKNCVEKKI